MARAINSFPVPVSPRMRTVESEGATLETRRRTFLSASDEPTMSSNIESRSICSLSARFSFRVLSSARTRSSISVPVAYQRVSCPCSFLKGLYRIRNQRFVSTDWSLEVSHQRYLHLRFRPWTTADHHRFS